MKFRALLLATSLLALAAIGAHAGIRQNVGGALGLAGPTGDLGNTVGMGYFLGVNYNARFTPQWGAGIDLNYFTFGEKAEAGSTSRKVSSHGGQSAIYGKYFFPMKDDRYSPYLKAGLYHYSIAFEAKSSFGTATAKETKPGYGLGVGALKKLDAKSSVGLELDYGWIQTEHSASLYQLGVGYYFQVGK